MGWKGKGTAVPSLSSASNQAIVTHSGGTGHHPGTPWLPHKHVAQGSPPAAATPLLTQLWPHSPAPAPPQAGESKGPEPAG